MVAKKIEQDPNDAEAYYTIGVVDWMQAYKTAVAILAADGSTDANSFYISAYSFTLDGNKAVRNISMPGNRDVLVFAMTLVPVSL